MSNLKYLKVIFVKLRYRTELSETGKIQSEKNT